MGRLSRQAHGFLSYGQTCSYKVPSQSRPLQPLVALWLHWAYADLGRFVA